MKSWCLCICIIGRGRGRGKRRFAPQGVWRSGGTGPDVDPVVWLPGTPKSFPRPPLPLPTQEVSSEGKPRKKDEFYLAEVHLMRGNLRERFDVFDTTPSSLHESSGAPTFYLVRASSTFRWWKAFTKHSEIQSAFLCRDLSSES